MPILAIRSLGIRLRGPSSLLKLLRAELLSVAFGRVRLLGQYPGFAPPFVSLGLGLLRVGPELLRMSPCRAAIQFRKYAVVFGLDLRLLFPHFDCATS